MVHVGKKMARRKWENEAVFDVTQPIVDRGAGSVVR
jgi:hypothetical protein